MDKKDRINKQDSRYCYNNDVLYYSINCTINVQHILCRIRMLQSIEIMYVHAQDECMPTIPLLLQFYIERNAFIK